jgi:hypothetical protein
MVLNMLATFVHQRMASVWTTRPNQEIVLGCQIRRDIALSLTADLAADQDIDQRLMLTGIKVQVTHYANQHVGRSIPCRVDYDVGIVRELVDTPLRSVPPDVLVGPWLTRRAFAPCRMSQLKFVEWGGEVYMHKRSWIGNP